MTTSRVHPDPASREAGRAVTANLRDLRICTKKQTRTWGDNLAPQDRSENRGCGTCNQRGKNIKYAPPAFTEHGAIMAASVLNSPRAVQIAERQFFTSFQFFPIPTSTISGTFSTAADCIRSRTIAARVSARPSGTSKRRLNA